MPYASVEDLPSSVRKLPRHAQMIFLDAFNSAWEGSCKGDPDKEECAHSIAWAAVGKAYDEKDGKWTPLHKCEGPRCFFSNVETSIPTHEVIIQGLNRWMNYEGKRYYYAAENFQGTEPDWMNVPAIFAQSHPDPNLVSQDLEAALNSIKDYKGGPGRLLNRPLKDLAVTIPGQPRLAGKIDLGSPELEDLWGEGKLSLSSAFICYPRDDGKLTGKVEPNHILFFVQDDRNQPRDPAAMLLKSVDVSEVNDVTKQAVEHEGRVISGANATELDAIMSDHATIMGRLKDLVSKMRGTPAKVGNADPGFGASPSGTGMPGQGEGGSLDPQEQANKANEDKMTAELETKLNETAIALKNKEDELKTKDTALVALNADIEKMKAEKDALQVQVNKADQDRKDVAWAALKNSMIPAGWVDTPEKEAAERAKAENADPTVRFAFMQKLGEQVRSHPETERQGLEHAGDPDKKKSPAKGTIGVWNAHKQAYE